MFGVAIEFGQGLLSIFNLSKGDVVLVVTDNTIDFAPIILGILWTGATVSTANPSYTPTELEQQMRDSSARLVVASKYEAIKDACKMVGIQDAFIILTSESHGDDDCCQLQHWCDIRCHDSGVTARPTINPGTDVAFLIYSSGTTGLPKGVMLSHYNMVASTMQILMSEQGNLTWDGSQTALGIPLPQTTKNGDVVLVCLPLFHIYALSHMILQPLYSGWKALVMTRFDMTKWCRAVQDHHVTFAYIVPPIALLLANHAAAVAHDLSSIRYANSGAAPLPADLIAKVWRRTGIRIKQSYGLSECSPCVCAPGWEGWPSHATSSGHLLPNMRLRFLELPADGESGKSPGTRAGKEMSPQAGGEIQLKGPNVFLGYHNNQVATSAAFTSDGWFKTGDIGHLDEAGNLYVTDRLKELIKYKGFQIAPAELEQHLRQHPLVADVAVVGVRSVQQATEIPRAYIVPKSRTTPSAVDRAREDAQEIIEWLSQRVVPYKRLRGGVRFVKSLPRNASGKVLRRVLRDEAAKESTDAIASL